MRTTATFAAVATLAILGAAGPAAAQQSTEAYQVTFEPVANSCEESGIKLDKARVVLTRRGKALSVAIPQIPVMTGTAGRRGNFKARVKRGKTGVSGLEGKFSIAGSVKGRSIQFVFIAEYYKGGKPLCTQSWKGSGTRASNGTKTKSALTRVMAGAPLYRVLALRL